MTTIKVIAAARGLAVQYDATLNAIRASSDKDLEAYAKGGGFDKVTHASATFLGHACGIQ